MQGVEFNLEERRNVHVKGEKEWALNVRWAGSLSWWTLFTWVNKPSEGAVCDMKYVFNRSASIAIDYAKAEVHRNLSNLTRRN